MSSRLIKGKLTRLTPKATVPYKLYFGIENIETIEGEKRSESMDVPIVLSFFDQTIEAIQPIVDKYNSWIGKEIFIREEQSPKNPIWWNVKAVGLSLEEVKEPPTQKYLSSNTKIALERIEKRLDSIDSKLSAIAEAGKNWSN